MSCRTSKLLHKLNATVTPLVRIRSISLLWDFLYKNRTFSCTFISAGGNSNNSNILSNLGGGEGGHEGGHRAIRGGRRIRNDRDTVHLRNRDILKVSEWGYQQNGSSNSFGHPQKEISRFLQLEKVTVPRHNQLYHAKSTMIGTIFSIRDR